MRYFYKNNIFKHNIIEESMNKQKTKDLNLGGFCEQEFLKLYGNRYNKLKNQFSVIDFKHKKKKIIVELKARRYAFDGGIGDGAWQIGKNKIQKGKQLLNKGYTFYIYMVFLDGLYYYKYDLHQNFQIIRDLFLFALLFLLFYRRFVLILFIP